ncbi:MAG: colanic acid biosynthesis glycosyltransferase WcaI [Hymenobacter sp.]|nr:MAG: colanic acid biosynthesis glycosyltransferase WcaI [Hymenobacter sp.]
MQKTILLIGYNFHPELTGIGKYSGEMMQWLAERGYACEVVTAYPYYPDWQVQAPYQPYKYWYRREQRHFASGGSLTVHRCPMYIPDKPTGLKRMLLDFSFLVTAFFKVLQISLAQKPAYTIAVAPSFQFGLLGILSQKLSGTKLVYHIHDMQIEAARDLHILTSPALLKVLFQVEKYIFKQAAIVSSISKQMVSKIAHKAGKPVALFPNWVDNKQFFPLPPDGDFKEKLGFAATDKLLLYSGAMGEKQGLEAILHAAQHLQQHPEVKFILCGSGPYKSKLMEQATQLGLRNVFFFPLQPLESFNAFLNAAYLHLIIQKAGASDLMMPSKLTTILAVGGLALITANEGSELHTLIHEQQLGLLVEAESTQALTEGIRRALSTNTEQMRQNARAYAATHLSIHTIMQNFEHLLQEA